jgi:hypothetical protein
MGYGVSQGERTSPATTENMHFAEDVQLPTQFQYVLDEMLSRIVGKGCRRVVVARAGCTLSAPALIEKNDPISLRIKKAGRRVMTSSARPAMHEHDRLAVYRTVFFPVNPVLRIPMNGKVAGFVAR